MNTVDHSVRRVCNAPRPFRVSSIPKTRRKALSAKRRGRSHIPETGLHHPDLSAKGKQGLGLGGHIQPNFLQRIGGINRIKRAGNKAVREGREILLPNRNAGSATRKSLVHVTPSADAGQGAVLFKVKYELPGGTFKKPRTNTRLINFKGVPTPAARARQYFTGQTPDPGMGFWGYKLSLRPNGPAHPLATPNQGTAHTSRKPGVFHKVIDPFQKVKHYDSSAHALRLLALGLKPAARLATFVENGHIVAPLRRGYNRFKNPPTRQYKIRRAERLRTEAERVAEARLKHQAAIRASRTAHIQGTFAMDPVTMTRKLNRVEKRYDRQKLVKERNIALAKAEEAYRQTMATLQATDSFYSPRRRYQSMQARLNRAASRRQIRWDHSGLRHFSRRLGETVKEGLVARQADRAKKGFSNLMSRLWDALADAYRPTMNANAYGLPVLYS